jgi:hypothetical protein
MYCATTNRTSNSMQLNLSKHAPQYTEPLKNSPIFFSGTIRNKQTMHYTTEARLISVDVSFNKKHRLMI